MKDNKYYTPELNEIWINYEMEWLQKANGDWSVLDGVDKDTWQKWDYNFQGFSIKGIEGLIQDQRIRTKYLDKEDIESLGWKFDGNKADDWKYYYGEYQLYFPYADQEPILITKAPQSLFYGEIKSINELKKVMQYIGVIITH